MNKNIWNLYKNSEKGKNAISLFTISDDDNLERKIKAIYKFCEDFLGNADIEDLLSRFFLITDNIFADEILINEDESASEYFNRLIDNIEIGIIDISSEGEVYKVRDEKPLVKQKDYKAICSLISDISLSLFTFNPDCFLPILFPEKFDTLMKILDILEIPLPQLPASTDKRGRLLFYNDLCDNIFKFSEDNNLTAEETCACIYDFATMLLEETANNDSDLPEPTNIWLTGGSKEDYETFLKNPKIGEKSVWTCSENTKRGDIIVMYVRTPHSCIQSIWRADIDGIYTPFNYYNSRTQIINGITFPHITLDEIKSDPYFSQLPITRKNFQGVNGVQFSANDYKELQRILNAKGFDTSVLPQLYNPSIELMVELENEKDVEEKLLIPLLKKMGYLETDWTRQLSQKAGRKEKAIPDFVFFPNGEIHFQNAPMIIEAKYDMSSNLERTKSYNQALSYARMMKSSILGICDKDRLIIYKEKGGTFDRFKPIFEKHWESINGAEVFSQLKQIIGREIIEIKKILKNSKY
jgi:hypothetical protein